VNIKIYDTVSGKVIHTEKVENSNSTYFLRVPQILVLDDGEMVGIGTHAELLESCEVYREIYDSQFKKEEGGRING